MAEIKHFIVLMMENRSFDHMLGFLKAPGYDVDGLTGTESNLDAAGNRIVVSNDAPVPGDLGADPKHGFDDVTEQLFGTATPATGQRPDMSGFVKNFGKYAGADGRNVMKAFRPAALPVLATLARFYAVCDRWFCSVPGPTLPNRLYAHAGTSRGRLDMSPDYFGGFRTIYEVLWNAHVESAIFFHDWSSTLSFDFMLKHEAEMYAPFNAFLELCGNGDLPAYSFIEPRYNPQSDDGGAFLPANDQHPDHDVAAGEQLIRQVYEGLRSNDEVWQSSLLLIVYDEHGGLYDHVPPTDPCESPDGVNASSPDFDFRRYGPRVPAVIVSPYISRGRIIHDRVFDHTSLLATAIRLFATKARNPQHGIDWPSDILGRRAMTAQPLDDLLNLDAPPRMERPDFAAHDPAFAGPPRIVAPLLSGLQLEAVRHARALELRLPPEKQTGVDPKTIVSEQAAGDYVSGVMAAILSRDITSKYVTVVPSATKPVLKAFLCHSSVDKPEVKKLYNDLKRDGYDPWLDSVSLVPGDNWEAEIKRAVRDSHVVIVCLSETAVTKAGFAQKEIKFALDVADELPEGRTYIIPARLEDCTVPERLSQRHWVNLYESDGYAKLLTALQKRASQL